MGVNYFVRDCTAFSNGSSRSPGVVSGSVSKISFVAAPALWSSRDRSLALLVTITATSRFRNLESHFFHLAACVLVSDTSDSGNVGSAVTMFQAFAV